MNDSSENPWVRIASSVLVFDWRSLPETWHAGSDAYPGRFPRFRASQNDVNDPSEKQFSAFSFQLSVFSCNYSAS